MTDVPGSGSPGADDPDAVRLPDPRMIRQQAGRPEPAAAPASEPEPEQPPEPSLRPFIITRGRTTPADTRLRIETQIQTVPGPEAAAADYEHRGIVELCRQRSLSIAEISAALQLPFGVTRVLVADLVASGAVVAHQPESDVSRAAVERILERVHGL
jgi:Protein of unknown function (DUF742)